jgi:hypothetical protein
MSGLSHTPGKRAWGYTHRGFESRLFRQLVNEYAPSGALFHFCIGHYLALLALRSSVHLFAALLPSLNS